MESNILNKSVVGVDLGGTNIRTGRVCNGLIQEDSKCLVPKQDAPADKIIQLIIENITAVMNNEVQAIGIGIPSLLNREEGIVYDVQNISSWKKVPLKSILENRFNIPVHLDNDANCFALGERIYGDGQDIDNFVGLTLGTGVGSGIIKNGILMQDENCGSGEFGSIPYLNGTYEDYCSGKFFKSNYNCKGEDLFNKAMLGDSEAQDAFKTFGVHLGNAIKTIMFAVDPKMIVIGGSIVKANNLFGHSMLTTISSFPYSRSINGLKICYSGLVNPAILGASALCFNFNEEKTKKVKL